ncbi:hypothetical protein H0H93_016909, partial [Arthromyces matolae]
APSLGENEITNPTRKEYAVRAAKETLETIVAVASAVPIPAFGAAVKAAAAIIKACDDSKATLERAEELKTRVQTIVVLLVDELKGKSINVLERQTKMMGDIDVLQKYASMPSEFQKEAEQSPVQGNGVYQDQA